MSFSHGAMLQPLVMSCGTTPCVTRHPVCDTLICFWSLLKSVATEFPCCTRTSVVRAYPGLFCTHSLLYRDTTRRHTVVCASPRTPSPVVCGRVFCLGQLYRDIKIFYRERNYPYLGQLYRDIELLCGDIKIFSRDLKSS